MTKLSMEVERAGRTGHAKLALLELAAPFSQAMRRRRDRRKIEMARWNEKCATVQRFEHLLTQLTPGDVCLDLGANVGKITRLFAETGATVHAFEPDPWAFERLKASVNDYDTVHLHHAAVGARKDTVYLKRQDNFDSAPEQASTGSMISAESDGIPVEQIDLVSFLEALQQPVRILKMDIEGSEIDVLTRLFDHPALDRIEHLFVETHEFRPHLAAATADLRASVPKRNWGSISLDWI